MTPQPPEPTPKEGARRAIESLRAQFNEQTQARRRSRERERESQPPLRDAVGQIPCMILSFPIVGLILVAAFLAVEQFAAWVWGLLLTALGNPLVLGMSGLGAFLAGVWMATLIITGKSTPGTTWAAKLLALGFAVFLGVLGAAFLAAAITTQRAGSAF